MGLGGLVLGSLILYLKGMRIQMFQLSGFYCIQMCSQRWSGPEVFPVSWWSNLSYENTETVLLTIDPYRLMDKILHYP